MFMHKQFYAQSPSMFTFSLDILNSVYNTSAGRVMLIIIMRNDNSSVI